MRISGRFAAAALAAALCGCDSGGSPSGPDPAQADLDALALATERYLDVANARADGFVQASPCESNPAGPGAMGMHFVNAARVDQRVVLTEPELLLYVQEGDRLALVGVEYFVPVLQDGRPYNGTAPPSVTAPAPTVFGRALDGPMPGHTATMPWHYDLHVWVFRANPNGLFAHYNPSVRCP